MDWAVNQPRIRFDIRAEREEYERLFKHPARALQDRLVRRGGGELVKINPGTSAYLHFKVDHDAS